MGRGGTEGSPEGGDEDIPEGSTESKRENDSLPSPNWHLGNDGPLAGQADEEPGGACEEEGGEEGGERGEGGAGGGESCRDRCKNTFRAGRTFDSVLAAFSEEGYSVQWRVVNARHWLPQNRERASVLSSPLSSFPLPSFPLFSSLLLSLFSDLLSGRSLTRFLSFFHVVTLTSGFQFNGSSYVACQIFFYPSLVRALSLTGVAGALGTQ